MSYIWFKYCNSYCPISTKGILWSIHLTNPLIFLHVLNIFFDHYQSLRENTTKSFSDNQNVLVSILCLSPKCLWEHANCVDTCFGLFVFLPLYVPTAGLLELLGWALCVDSWFPCHLMSTSSFSNTNLLPKLPEISQPRQQSERQPSFSFKVSFQIHDHLMENTSDRLWCPSVRNWNKTGWNKKKCQSQKSELKDNICHIWTIRQRQGCL